MTSDIIQWRERINFVIFSVHCWLLVHSNYLNWLSLNVMIYIKDAIAIEKMIEAGKRLGIIFSQLPEIISEGISTLEIDVWIAQALQSHDLKTTMKGYHGYQHVSCISINDEVVHGVPKKDKIIKKNDLVKVDVCASFKGYCADMTRPFFMGTPASPVRKLIDVSKQALEVGIKVAIPGNKVSDISFAIQEILLANNYGIIREFAGHGIGKNMHEDPDVFNYGKPGRGAMLKAGMALAIEPMVTLGKDAIYIEEDDWTVRTQDGSLAMHIEDTIIITDNGPLVTTIVNKEMR